MVEMKKNFVLLSALLLAFSACGPQTSSDPEVAAWEARADNIEIIRDDWGVPHIYAPTDADAVFGLMYAQAEDDFNRIEVNFLTSLGRMAEAEGDDRLWQDLRMRLFINPVELQAMYGESPQWLKDLMDGWADGLNYYLQTHPETQPRVLTHFEPWMALSFSEGSIGGDIERVNLRNLEEFYGNPEGQRSAVRVLDAEERLAGTTAMAMVNGDSNRWAFTGPRISQDVESSLVVPDLYLEPQGSNGIAIGDENTVNGNSLLLINPHTSFFFRHEAHVISEEGLNAYGALTWGQFFIYQGFNENAGWMHTSSSVDNIDEFLETIVERDGQLFYVYGDEERDVEVEETTVQVRNADGSMSPQTFTTYRTHHGPIVRGVDGRWVAVALMEEPLKALIQSYSRTKAQNLDEYLEVMETHTNSSNNTLFADSEGNAAYLHSNFIPRRDTRFDYSRPVDGSDPATDWQGVHTLEESPNSINPSTGFAYCSNNWPYSTSGTASPLESAFPSYMDTGSENPRGIHALELLPGKTDFTLEGLLAVAFDSHQPYFDPLMPVLAADYDALPASDPRRAELGPAIELLRDWDRRWGGESVETSVAVFWATLMPEQMRDAQRPAGMSNSDFMVSRAFREGRLAALSAALTKLTEDFGQWDTPWGEINRFQRVNGDIVQPFNDDLPSTPVIFSSARWGSLASFGSRQYPDTKKWYGTSGNSFVAVVEFGDQVRARAVTAGGLNSVPGSPHFDDQAERYATGNLRDVWFYRPDVEANAERTYRPGGR